MQPLPERMMEMAKKRRDEWHRLNRLAIGMMGRPFLLDWNEGMRRWAPWFYTDPNPFPKFTFLTWRRRGDKR